MPYTAEISRTNPSCFVFILDQSGSMSDNYVDIGKPKSEAVADVINKLLQQLTIKCYTRGELKDYYMVSVIGYGANGVGSAFGGNLSGKEMVPITQIANNPARIEERTKKVSDGAGGLVDQNIKFPVWFDPTASGGTPMTAAFRKANDIVSNWLNSNPNCFPPIVIHITDGESTDGDPSTEMQKLIAQSSNDGSVILFNLHTNARNVTPITFPTSGVSLPDQYSEMLFNNASILPAFIREVATKDFGMTLSEGAKGFIMNGDITLIITAIEIGTRASLQLMR
jgi:hypothetical protein